MVIPEEIKASSDLTDYAVNTRYPGMYEPLRDDEYQEALAVAQRVVSWVYTQLA